MTRFRVCLALVLAACSRDLTVSEPPVLPTAGVSGHVVYAVPGRVEKRAAAGAVVSILGSGLETRTTPGGTFLLEGVEETDGRLLIRFDSDSDGVIDHQRVLSLADYGTGPHVRVDVGEVTLGENASVHGRILLGTLPGQRSGHAGTAVFVPEGPYTAITGDDGSFFLPNLPEGPLQFFAFRSGFTAQSLGTVTLRSGEDFAFRDVTIEMSTEPQVAGSIVGRVLLLPAAAVGDTAVTAQAPLQAAVTGTVNADFTFSFPMVDPGLYTVTATRTGYTPASTVNVLVLPGKEASIGAIGLTDQPVADAGMQPPVDAGASDPGDGGTCTLNAQCRFDEWCDDGLCRHQCSTANDCTSGRICELNTRTCQRACSSTPQCGAQNTCDLDAGVCRRVCDGAFPCAAGFKCEQSRCVPECATAGDCAAHFTCQQGQCVADFSCDSDLDCDGGELCAGAQCMARITQRTDAGFRCANPCDCRLDEWCHGGICESARPPTLYFSSAGSGSGRTPATASSQLDGLDAGPGDVVALKENDTFTIAAPPLDLSRGNGIAFAGGYRDCGMRWVRGDGTTTTLTGDGGILLTLNGNASVPVLDARIAGLKLLPLQPSCDVGVVSVRDTQRLQVRDVSCAFAAGFCMEGGGAVLECSGCFELEASDVTLIGGATAASAVRAPGSSGTITNVKALQFASVPYQLNLVMLDSPAGNWVVRGTELPEVTVISEVRAVEAANCSSNVDVTIEDSRIAYPHSGLANLIRLDGCQAHVRNNLIDGTGVGLVPSTSNAISFVTGSRGEISGNTVLLPSSGQTVNMYGIRVNGTGGRLDIKDNRILGGQTAGSLAGVWIDQTSNGPHLLDRNVVDVGPARDVAALNISQVDVNAGFIATDDFFRATGDGSCTSAAVGAYLASTAGRIERCRMFASGAGNVNGLSFASNAGPVEVFSSHVWAGGAACSMYGATAVRVQSSSPILLQGNTLDAHGDPLQGSPNIGVYANNATVTLDSNIVSGGTAPVRRILDGSGTRFRNYFWYERQQLEAFGNGDDVPMIFGTFATDGGPTIDANGNVFYDNVSPFAAAQPTLPDGGVLPPFRLAAGSLCIDRGQIASRSDGSKVLTDLENRPRDGGAAADIGASER